MPFFLVIVIVIVNYPTLPNISNDIMFGELTDL